MTKYKYIEFLETSSKYQYSTERIPPKVFKFRDTKEAYGGCAKIGSPNS